MVGLRDCLTLLLLALAGFTASAWAGLRWGWAGIVAGFPVGFAASFAVLYAIAWMAALIEERRGQAQKKRK